MWIRGLSALAAALLLSSPAAQAASIALLTDGAAAFVEDAIFQLNQSPDSSGSGTFDTFLRIGASGGGQNPEFGMNTSDAPGDTKTGVGFITELLLSSIPTIDIAGVTYFEILLDFNENQTTPEIAQLDVTELQLFFSGTGDLASTDCDLLGDGGTTCGPATPFWDMDGSEDNTVILSAENAGSGADDLQVLVPLTGFGGDASSTYLYLYSAFDRAANGFEEWSIRTPPSAEVPPPTIPEPGTLLLLGTGLAGLGALGRRRSAAAASRP